MSAISTRERVMPLYTFKVDSFHIDNTRALDEDTDIVGVGICVGDPADPNQQTDLQRKDVGNVDNGDHAVDLGVDVRVDDPSQSIRLCYFVANSGFDRTNASDSKKALDKISNLCEQAISDVFGFADVWKEVNRGIHSLNGLLFANCDGLVGADAVITTGVELSQKTSDGVGGNIPWTFTKSFPGTDSAVGCGSNSQYAVSCSVTLSDA
jgi:hypothetical protein